MEYHGCICFMCMRYTCVLFLVTVTMLEDWWTHQNYCKIRLLIHDSETLQKLYTSINQFVLKYICFMTTTDISRVSQLFCSFSQTNTMGIASWQFFITMRRFYWGFFCVFLLVFVVVFVLLSSPCLSVDLQLLIIPLISCKLLQVDRVLELAFL